MKLLSLYTSSWNESNTLVKSKLISSNPYFSATFCASVLSVFSEWQGSVTPSTFSGPIAFEKSAATTAESFPPLIPRTTPFKLFFC